MNTLRTAARRWVPRPARRILWLRCSATSVSYMILVLELYEITHLR